MKIYIVFFIVFVWVVESSHPNADGQSPEPRHQTVLKNDIEKTLVSRKIVHRKSDREISYASRRKQPVIRHTISSLLPQTLRNHINGKSADKWVNAGGSGRARLIPNNKIYKPTNNSPITTRGISKSMVTMNKKKKGAGRRAAMYIRGKVLKRNGLPEYRKESVRGDVDYEEYPDEDEDEQGQQRSGVYGSDEPDVKVDINEESLTGSKAGYQVEDSYEEKLIDEKLSKAAAEEAGDNFANIDDSITEKHERDQVDQGIADSIQSDEGLINGRFETGKRDMENMEDGKVDAILAEKKAISDEGRKYDAQIKGIELKDKIADKSEPTTGVDTKIKNFLQDKYKTSTELKDLEANIKRFSKEVQHYEEEQSVLSKSVEKGDKLGHTIVAKNSSDVKRHRPENLKEPLSTAYATRKSTKQKQKVTVGGDHDVENEASNLISDLTKDNEKAGSSRSNHQESGYSHDYSSSSSSETKTVQKGDEKPKTTGYSHNYTVDRQYEQEDGKKPKEKVKIKEKMVKYGDDSEKGGPDTKHLHISKGKKTTAEKKTLKASDRHPEQEEDSSKKLTGGTKKDGETADMKKIMHQFEENLLGEITRFNEEKKVPGDIDKKLVKVDKETLPPRYTNILESEVNRFKSKRNQKGYFEDADIGNGDAKFKSEEDSEDDDPDDEDRPKVAKDFKGSGDVLVNPHPDDAENATGQKPSSLKTSGGESGKNASSSKKEETPSKVTTTSEAGNEDADSALKGNETLKIRKIAKDNRADGESEDTELLQIKKVAGDSDKNSAVEDKEFLKVKNIVGDSDKHPSVVDSEDKELLKLKNLAGGVQRGGAANISSNTKSGDELKTTKDVKGDEPKSFTKDAKADEPKSFAKDVKGDEPKSFTKDAKEDASKTTTDEKEEEAKISKEEKGELKIEKNEKGELKLAETGKEDEPKLAKEVKEDEAKPAKEAKGDEAITEKEVKPEKEKFAKDTGKGSEAELETSPIGITNNNSGNGNEKIIKELKENKTRLHSSKIHAQSKNPLIQDTNEETQNNTSNANDNADTSEKAKPSKAEERESSTSKEKNSEPEHKGGANATDSENPKILKWLEGLKSVHADNWHPDADNPKILKWLEELRKVYSLPRNPEAEGIILEAERRANDSRDSRNNSDAENRLGIPINSPKHVSLFEHKADPTQYIVTTTGEEINGDYKGSSNEDDQHFLADLERDCEAKNASKLACRDIAKIKSYTNSSADMDKSGYHDSNWYGGYHDPWYDNHDSYESGPWYDSKGDKPGDKPGGNKSSHSYGYSSSSETTQEGDKKPVTTGYSHDYSVDSKLSEENGKKPKGKLKIKGKLIKYGTEIEENKSDNGIGFKVEEYSKDVDLGNTSKPAEPSTNVTDATQAKHTTTSSEEKDPSKNVTVSTHVVAALVASTKEEEPSKNFTVATHAKHTGTSSHEEEPSKNVTVPTHAKHTGTSSHEEEPSKNVTVATHAKHTSSHEEADDASRHNISADIEDILKYVKEHRKARNKDKNKTEQIIKKLTKDEKARRKLKAYAVDECARIRDSKVMADPTKIKEAQAQYKDCVRRHRFPRPEDGYEDCEHFRHRKFVNVGDVEKASEESYKDCVLNHHRLEEGGGRHNLDGECVKLHDHKMSILQEMEKDAETNYNECLLKQEKEKTMSESEGHDLHECVHQHNFDSEPKVKQADADYNDCVYRHHRLVEDEEARLRHEEEEKHRHEEEEKNRHDEEEARRREEEEKQHQEELEKHRHEEEEVRHNKEEERRHHEEEETRRQEEEERHHHEEVETHRHGEENRRHHEEEETQHHDEEEKHHHEEEDHHHHEEEDHHHEGERPRHHDEEERHQNGEDESRNHDEEEAHHHDEEEPSHHEEERHHHADEDVHHHHEEGKDDIVQNCLHLLPHSPMDNDISDPLGGVKSEAEAEEAFANCVREHREEAEKAKGKDSTSIRGEDSYEDCLRHYNTQKAPPEAEEDFNECMRLHRLHGEIRPGYKYVDKHGDDTKDLESFSHHHTAEKDSEGGLHHRVNFHSKHPNDNVNNILDYLTKAEVASALDGSIIHSNVTQVVPEGAELNDIFTGQHAAHHKLQDYGAEEKANPISGIERDDIDLARNLYNLRDAYSSRADLSDELADFPSLMNRKVSRRGTMVYFAPTPSRRSGKDNTKPPEAFTPRIPYYESNKNTTSIKAVGSKGAMGKDPAFIVEPDATRGLYKVQLPKGDQHHNKEEHLPVLTPSLSTNKTARIRKHRPLSKPRKIHSARSSTGDKHKGKSARIDSKDKQAKVSKPKKTSSRVV